MTCDLTQKKCLPCEGGLDPIKGKELINLAGQIGVHWKVVDEHHLKAEYTFPDFRSALDLANQVGELAEEEGHHPDLHISYGKLGITLWTHAINGLSENDFILAAKIDALT